MSVLEVKQEIAKLEAEKKAFRFDLVRMCWYMRGGLTLSEAYMSTFEEREMVATLVKENLDTAKKTGQPFF
jgi:hypothetical protein